MRSKFHPHLLLAPALLLACVPAGSDGDPCEPGGHAHVGASETWCHCVAGYLPSADGLACEVDPDHVADDGFPFEEATRDACALVERGPTATVIAGELPPTINAFDTTYTVELTATAEGHRGVVRYDPHASGKAVLFLGADIPLEVREGRLTTTTVRGPAPTTCEALAAVHGVSLLADVGYTFHLGPASTSTVQLLVRLVP